MKKKLFEEVQSFDQLWLRLPLIVIGAGNIGLFAYGIIRQVIKGIPWGTKPMSDGMLIAVTLFIILLWTGLILLFQFSKLKTSITEEGIEIIFTPFIRQPKLFTAPMIKNWEIRKYNPIIEYGGYGVRYGMKGKAYNVKGRIGLQLEFMNGMKILIGTQKKDQMRWAMEKLLEKNTV